MVSFCFSLPFFLYVFLTTPSFVGLFSQIDLVHVPGLASLLREGETLADLQKMSAEQILMRWVNYHLEKAGVDRRLNNFTENVRDSEIYSYLLKQIAPHERNVTLDALNLPIVIFLNIFTEKRNMCVIFRCFLKE